MQDYSFNFVIDIKYLNIDNCIIHTVVLIIILNKYINYQINLNLKTNVNF